MASNKKPKTSLNSIAAATTCTYDQTPSLSAQIVADNDDLLIEILLCLPINSLLIFKSVSKHWLSLISDPQFCGRRCRTPLYNPSCGLFLLLHNPRLTNPDPVYDMVNLNQSSNLSSPVQSHIPNKPSLLRLSLAPYPMGMGIKILQSCNGLLLCSTFHLPEKMKKYIAYHATIKQEARKKYYVYNPTTKHYTILPQLPVLSGAPRTVLGLNLAFDPTKSPHYKVVCVRCCKRVHIHKQLDIEIYSSEMGHWRRSSSSSLFTPVPTYLEFNGGVYWNGAVHWINSWGMSGALCFNLEEDRLSEMPLPSLPEDWLDWNEKDFGYFGVSGDHLHLVGIYDSPSTHFNVYEMERDYSGWSVKFRVDVAQVLVAFSDAERFTLPVQDLSQFLFTIICVARCEVDEESYMVMHFPGAIVKYYLKTNSFMKLCDINDGTIGVGRDGLLYRGWTNTYQFIESLAYV